MEPAAPPPASPPVAPPDGSSPEAPPTPPTRPTRLAPDAWRRASGWHLALLLLCGALLFLPDLGRRHIWTSGEARVAQVARHMRATGDWIVPYMGEDLRLKKPPLAYWLVAVASLPFTETAPDGATRPVVSEGASRLPSALAGIGLMLVIYLFGCRLGGRGMGFYAGLMLGTTWIIWDQARTTGIEAPFLFFNTAAIYLWYRYDEGEGRAPGWLWACYAMLGLSVLMKGIGPVVVLPMILAILAFRGGWRRPRLWHHALGVLLAAAIVAPWVYLLAERLGGAAKFLAIWARESKGRFEGFDHIKLPHYFYAKILGDGQPWVLLALAGLMLCGRRHGRNLLYASAVALPILCGLVPRHALNYYEKRYEWAMANQVGESAWNEEIRLGEGLIEWGGGWIPWFAMGATTLLLLLPCVAIAYALSKRLPPEAGASAGADADADGDGDGRENPRRRADLAAVVPSAWAWMALLFFSIPMSKKSYYVLPVYPALALLAASWAIAWEGDGFRAATRRVLRWVVAVVGGVAVVAGIAIYPLAQVLLQKKKFWKYQGHDMQLALLAAGVVLLGVAFLYVARTDRARRLLVGAILAFAVLTFGLYQSTIDRQNAFKSDKRLAAIATPLLTPETQVYTFDISGEPILIYYLDRHVNRLWNDRSIYRALLNERPLLLLVEEDTVANFRLLFAVHSDDRALMNRLAHDPKLVNRGIADRPEDGWGLFRVRDGAAPPGPGTEVERARAYLRALVADPAIRVVYVGGMLERVEHPPVLNEGRWLRSTKR